MRIRWLSVFERIFHDMNEDCRLECILYGTKEECSKMQKYIVAGVVKDA